MSGIEPCSASLAFFDLRVISVTLVMLNERSRALDAARLLVLQHMAMSGIEPCSASLAAVDMHVIFVTLVMLNGRCKVCTLQQKSRSGIQPCPNAVWAV